MSDGRRRRWVIVSLAAIVLIACFTWWRTTRLEQYAVIVSPDQRYRLVVYRKPIWPATAPGQAGDAPGVVRLYDRSGQLLQESKVEMVQMVANVEWTADRVEVPLVFSFKLP